MTDAQIPRNFWIFTAASAEGAVRLFFDPLHRLGMWYSARARKREQARRELMRLEQLMLEQQRDLKRLETLVIEHLLQRERREPSVAELRFLLATMESRPALGRHLSTQEPAFAGWGHKHWDDAVTRKRLRGTTVDSEVKQQRELLQQVLLRDWRWQPRDRLVDDPTELHRPRKSEPDDLRNRPREEVFDTLARLIASALYWKINDAVKSHNVWDTERSSEYRRSKMNVTITFTNEDIYARREY